MGFTDFQMDTLVADLSPLLTDERSCAVFGPEKLDEAVCLLDRYLCKISIAMKDVVDVALRHLLGGQIANEQAGSERELVPFGFAHIFPLLIQEMIVLLLNILRPWLIVNGRCFSSGKLEFPATLDWCVGGGEGL